jgi:anti-sigma-K factor RskA
VAATLTCAECEELIALAALGVLQLHESADLDVHLRSCRRCRETARAFQQTAFDLVESIDLLEPPAALRRRILSAVYSSGIPRAGRATRWLRALWRRIPQGPAYTVGGVVALAAAAAFAVLAMRSAVAPTRTFALDAAAGQPAAHGELVFYPSTSHSVLEVRGLPATPGASRVYEVWLITNQGSAQPVAFLSATPYGHTWTAVVGGDILEYQALAATLEPPGGTAHPTGPKVFSVALRHG